MRMLDFSSPCCPCCPCCPCSVFLPRGLPGPSRPPFVPAEQASLGVDPHGPRGRGDEEPVVPHHQPLAPRGVEGEAAEIAGLVVAPGDERWSVRRGQAPGGGGG